MKLPIERYRVVPGSDVDPGTVDPGDTGPFPANREGRMEARELLRRQRDRLEELQRLLYADGSRPTFDDGVASVGRQRVDLRENIGTEATQQDAGQACVTNCQ